MKLALASLMLLLLTPMSTSDEDTTECTGSPTDLCFNRVLDLVLYCDNPCQSGCVSLYPQPWGIEPEWTYTSCSCANTSEECICCHVVLIFDDGVPARKAPNGDCTNDSCSDVVCAMGYAPGGPSLGYAAQCASGV